MSADCSRMVPLKTPLSFTSKFPSFPSRKKETSKKKETSAQMSHGVGKLVNFFGGSTSIKGFTQPTSTNSIRRFRFRQVSWIRQLGLHVLLQHPRHVLQHLPAVAPGRSVFEALLGERSILPAARHVAAGRGEAVHDQGNSQQPWMKTEAEK